MKKFAAIIVIFLIFGSTYSFAEDKMCSPATGNFYFDIATGHKYITNQDGTYSEYSKKGDLLRSAVPNTAYLLVSGKYILEVTPEHSLVYEKRQNNDITQKVLPALSQHPQGWQCKQMVSTVQKEELPTAEAYEPKE